MKLCKIFMQKFNIKKIYPTSKSIRLRIYLIRVLKENMLCFITLTTVWDSILISVKEQVENKLPPLSSDVTAHLVNQQIPMEMSWINTPNSC